MKNDVYPFEPLLTRREALAGAVYILVHFLVLPLLFEAAAQLSPWFTVGRVNLLYYAAAVIFLAVFMGRWLYRQYDRFVDRPFWCIGSMAGAYLVNYLLSGLLVLFFSALELELGTTPNDSAIMELQGFDMRVVKAVSLYLAPVLEETLMRGVVFGTLRRVRRGAAYAVSALLFAFCHIWMYAPEGMLFWLTLAQYIPVSIALCYAYERSGSVWTSVFLHMFINAMGYTAMSLMG